MKVINQVKIVFQSHSVNEGFARGAAAAFLAQADPTVAQLADVKTALSEAVTNCIVHAYPGGIGRITLDMALYEDNTVKLVISDNGCGIPDIRQAMQPLFTTGDPEERAGLGFAVMQSFMDSIRVASRPGRGTRVTLKKQLRTKE